MTHRTTRCQSTIGISHRQHSGPIMDECIQSRVLSKLLAPRALYRWAWLDAGVTLPLRPLQGAFTHARPAAKRCRRSLTCKAQSNLVEERIGSSNGSVEEAPRSLYNTGASDLTKPGPLSLIDHEIAHEKTVVFVRHGMTTWNEQKRIQVNLHAVVARMSPSCMVHAIMRPSSSFYHVLA